LSTNLSLLYQQAFRLLAQLRADLARETSHDKVADLVRLVTETLESADVLLLQHDPARDVYAFTVAATLHRELNALAPSVRVPRYASA